MNRKTIEKAFLLLNDRLRDKNIKGKIGVVGGSAMLLAFNSREATKDVDALFRPCTEIRKAAEEVSQELDLPPDWLNDGVKGYLGGELKVGEILFEYDHLTVYLPPIQLLLAMKAISARFDTNDKEDFITICKHLKIKKMEKALKIIEDYYPRNQIPAKTIFFLEELFLEE